jgi:Glyoxalase-like domain
MAVARSGFVSLDCADPMPLAEFWASMLGGKIMLASATTVGVRTDWVWLSAMKVPDYQPPTWPDSGVPKQIHLDLAVDDLTSVAEAQRLGPPSRQSSRPPTGECCSTPQVTRSA